MNLFAYYHCDQWKMKDSMDLVGVFQEDKLKEAIIEDVKNETIKLDEREEEEIKTMDIRTLNSLIEFGHIQEVKLNERQ